MVVPVRIFRGGFSSLGGLGSVFVFVGVGACACCCGSLSLRDDFETPISSSLSFLFRF